MSKSRLIILNHEAGDILAKSWMGKLRMSDWVSPLVLDMSELRTLWERESSHVLGVHLGSIICELQAPPLESIATPPARLESSWFHAIYFAFTALDPLEYHSSNGDVQIQTSLFHIVVIIIIIIIIIKLNLWLTVPREPHRSTRLLQLTDRWHYAPSSLIMSTFLTRFTTSQSSSFPIVLTRLGGPCSRPNSH